MKRIALFLILSACASGARGPAGKPAKGEVPPPVAVPPVETFKMMSNKEMNPFTRVTEPMGAPRVVGKYAGGCLYGGEAMPRSGPGYEMMRVDSRNRHWGHPMLIDVLKRGGEALKNEFTMLYGDLAQPRGGPMPGGHQSHQNGLDADIWFHRFGAAEKLTEEQRENLFGASVLRKNYLRKKMHLNYREIDPRKWDETYTRQLLWFAEQPETERIFVNAAIKKMLCKQFPGDPRLARLRPWYYHDDHFHLRLKCPAGDTSCVPQDPAAGIECEDKDFAPYFTAEVIAKFYKSEKSPPFEAKLPVECKPLIGL